jgi:hypothetical protein
MALATRRLEEQAYDATCDVFDYMKEFGSKPSGEAIEIFARLTVRACVSLAISLAHCRR